MRKSFQVTAAPGFASSAASRPCPCLGHKCCKLFSCSKEQRRAKGRAECRDRFMIAYAEREKPRSPLACPLFCPLQVILHCQAELVQCEEAWEGLLVFPAVLQGRCCNCCQLSQACIVSSELAWLPCAAVPDLEVNSVILMF